MSRITAAVLAGLAITAIAAPAAASAGHSSGSGRWVLTGASSVPNNYWQGLTTDPADENVFFVGIFEGLWRTAPKLQQNAGVETAIPASVEAQEGYNHIGDPTWNGGEGGRVVLPMECYTPGIGNTCGTGAFGVADPQTLAFDYYVKLDPAEIPKAMWAETSPDGSLVWTSSGDDLLAYSSDDIKAANAGPGGPLLEPVSRLVDAVPPSGITGAVFRGNRLLLAGADDDGHQIWSVNTETGERRLILQRSFCGEAEGLDLVPTLGGKLHWLLSPFDPGCDLSFGPTSALLHFVHSQGRNRYDVEVLDTDSETVPGRVTATIKARRGDGKPLRQARISFAGGSDRTDGRGVAKVSTRVMRPGRFKAFAKKHGRWGTSELTQVGEPPARHAIPRHGAA